MHFRIISFFVGTMISSVLSAPRFGGGMMFHTSYTHLSTSAGNVEGMGHGLGGRISATLGEHCRIGSLGGSYSVRYDVAGIEGSSLSLGYGGILAEYTHRIGTRGRLSAGAFIGGGSLRHYRLVAQESFGYRAAYKKNGTMIASPLLTCEYQIRPAIALMLAGDCLFGTDLGEGNRLGSPGVRLGILFAR